MKHLKSLHFGPRGQIAWPILILFLLAWAATLWAVDAATTEDSWLQLVVIVVFGELYVVLSSKASKKRPFNETKATIKAKMDLGLSLAIPGFILAYVSYRYIYPDAGLWFWMFVWIFAPYTLAMNVWRAQRTR